MSFENNFFSKRRSVKANDMLPDPISKKDLNSILQACKIEFKSFLLIGSGNISFALTDLLLEKKLFSKLIMFQLFNTSGVKKIN